MAAPMTNSQEQIATGHKVVGIWSRLVRPIGMLAVYLVAVFFGVRTIGVLVFERLFSPTTSKIESLQQENQRLKEEIRRNYEIIADYGQKISSQTARIDCLKSAIADSFFTASSQLSRNNGNAHNTQQHAASADVLGQQGAQPPTGNTQAGIVSHEHRFRPTDAAQPSVPND